MRFPAVAALKPSVECVIHVSHMLMFEVSGYNRIVSRALCCNTNEGLKQDAMK